MAQQLIVNGLVVTGGDNSKVIPGGAVCYDGATIVEVGTTAALEKKYPAAKQRNVNGMVVMPGYICTHHHLYSTMARGMGIPGTPASNFSEILERLWWKVDYALGMEDVKYSALIPLCECIRNGTTTIIDHHAGPSCREGSLDVIADAVKHECLAGTVAFDAHNGRAASGISCAVQRRACRRLGRCRAGVGKCGSGEAKERRKGCEAKFHGSAPWTATRPS